MAEEPQWKWRQWWQRQPLWIKVPILLPISASSSAYFVFVMWLFGVL
jgi:hypothetical protein